MAMRFGIVFILISLFREKEKHSIIIFHISHYNDNFSSNLGFLFQICADKTSCNKTITVIGYS